MSLRVRADFRAQASALWRILTTSRTLIGYAGIVIQVIGLILVGQKIAIGWLCGITAELIWIKRGRDNRMPDLMTMAAIYIGVAAWNFWTWSNA